MRLRATGVLLAGGRAARFGGDKRMARLGGETLVARSARALRAAVDELVVLHGALDPAPLVGLVPGDAILAPDPGLGPLPALHLAATASPSRWIVVAPADAPLVSPELFRLLLEAAEGRAGAVTVRDGVANPVLATYDRLSLRAATGGLLDDGFDAPRALLDALAVALLDESALAKVPFGPDSVLDVDEPGDLVVADRAIARARRG